MNELNEKLDVINKKLSIHIEEQILFDILFEMERVFDKQFSREIHNAEIKLNHHDRKKVRYYYYYGIESFLNETGVNSFRRYVASSQDKLNVLESCIERCETYQEEKIIKSIEERYKIISTGVQNCNSKKWLKYYYEKKNRESEFSLFILNYSQDEFKKDNYDINNIFDTITDIYNKLENYRHFVFNLAGKLFDANMHDVTWKVLYKIGVFCENFVLFEGEFFPFDKDKEMKIQELTDFLKKRFKNSLCEKLSREFYQYISTGFKYEDCLISDTQEKVLLIFQKISLDTRNIPCPACMTTIQSGNSYPELFKKSFECKNPRCPERSKSGRGKRFDEYGTYRYFKLVENHRYNVITDSMYKRWRKDIFSNKNNVHDMLIKYYSWNGETVCSNQDINGSLYGRKFKRYIISKEKNAYIHSFEELPIYKLFAGIYKLIKIKDGKCLIEDEIIVVNGDSTKEIEKLCNGQFGTAITSPPYYNAREYSQWGNLILYLVDMMRNSKVIFDRIADKGYYLYNIGDIVSADNIYVSSNMSKRRLQLGFLSSMIFEICGFNLTGNIIWDKGEVQSKRNSTPNHNSGYVKSINCYEHILVFKKGTEKRIISTVKKMNPVIKMGHNGENRVGHTAPYPLELVELVRPFINKEKHILDPFLGSGTTMIWCKRNKYKGIGFELSKDYFELAKNRINNTTEEV